jgi:hypothetical protein
MIVLRNLPCSKVVVIDTSRLKFLAVRKEIDDSEKLIRWHIRIENYDSEPTIIDGFTSAREAEAVAESIASELVKQRRK